MGQAWAVLPVFAGVYVVAAPPGWLVRVRDVAAMTAVASAGSLSWLTYVWSVPRAQRPYIDATVDDNPFSLAFGYNLLDRFGHASGAESAIAAAGTPANELGWRTLIEPVYYAPQFSWLALPALFALAAGLVSRRGLPRTDPVRAGFLLWGGWLLIHVAAFSSATAFHGYYTVALVPPIAALAGAGAIRFRHSVVFPAAIAGGAAWSAYLSLRHPHFVPWLLPATVTLAGAAITAWSLPRRVPGRATDLLAASALLSSPLVWSVAALDPVYAGTGFAPMAGPVGSNYQRVVLGHQPLPVHRLGRPAEAAAAALLDFLVRQQGTAKYLVATQGESPAEPFLPAGTAPVLVLGGFTGVTPFPAPEAFTADVASGQVRYALLSVPGTATPTTGWIRASCRPLATVPTPSGTSLYDCRP
jgi:4-amino-4-deoxy-L-arabinose transferase-like glycosyltransferase